ncbi:MAG: methyltransferase domain-containing protein [Pseudomonadota bacterium]
MADAGTSGLDPVHVQAFGSSVDFGRTAADYAAHRAGFPPELLDRFATLGLVKPGQRAIDVGTGTGTLARQLAARGLAVTGIDPATALLDEARSLDEAAAVTVDYRIGTAEHLPLGDDRADFAIAGQCWHWFDRPAAAREMRRILRPGGTLAIAHFDWLPLAQNVVAATEALILKHNPAWALAGGSGIYPDWLADLTNAGFEGTETLSFDMVQPYSHVAWRGRIRASAGVRASLDAAAVARFDDELANLLTDFFPADPLLVPHRVWAVWGTSP